MPEDGCDLVVVGASAGGVEALVRFAQALPPGFPAPILVVLHVPATGPSLLPDILTRAGPLPATHAVDGDELRGGHIYVAPPDMHMVVTNKHVELNRGPRENGHPPAIDPLFRTAALAYGNRVAGVVLSGTLDDGTAGLSAIKLHDGATLVQDPDEALYPGMPLSAIEFVEPHHVETIDELVHTLVRLASTATGRPGKEATMDPAPDASAEEAQPGEIAPFSCPDCGGTLWETTDGGVVSYRCRVGHAYTMNALVASHEDSLEKALWSAYRALEEKAAMSRRVARRLAERGRSLSAQRLQRQADGAARQAETLKAVLDELQPPPDLGASAANAQSRSS
ncbi:MAG TPA: chemotaxis protein CheB [Gaiellaceae bacterium]|nr:chemotaxis protein CheB [Gaiellaceae bacterium]